MLYKLNWYFVLEELIVLDPYYKPANSWQLSRFSSGSDPDTKTRTFVTARTKT